MLLVGSMMIVLFWVGSVVFSAKMKVLLIGLSLHILFPITAVAKFLSKEEGAEENGIGIKIDWFPVRLADLENTTLLTANLSQLSEMAQVEFILSVMLALLIACVTSCKIKGLFEVFEVLVKLLGAGLAIEMLFVVVSKRIRHRSFIARMV
jgi:hypothetical protein